MIIVSTHQKPAPISTQKFDEKIFKHLNDDKKNVPNQNRLNKPKNDTIKNVEHTHVHTFVFINTTIYINITHIPYI